MISHEFKSPPLVLMYSGTDTYSEPLGMENGNIPNDAIQASTELDDHHSASRARLNAEPDGEKMGAWVPQESDESQWLLVDLGKVAEITKVSTQGGGEGSEQRVVSFVLAFSKDQENFQDYQENGDVKVSVYTSIAQCVFHDLFIFTVCFLIKVLKRVCFKNY